MKVLLAIIACLLAACCPVRAQNSDIIPCGSIDTTVNGTTAYAALGQCSFTTGPAGTVLLLGNFEAFCGAPGMTLQYFIAPGASQVNGSKFNGGVSSGILTVSGTLEVGSTYTIQSGQMLTGGPGTFFTPTPITGQLTQYSVANSSLSWSANTVTVTTSSPHSFNFGNTVVISGVTPSGYNGTFPLISVTSTTYTYSLLSNPGAETVPGTSTATSGSAGTYSIADGSLSVSPGTLLETLNPLPGGMTAITPAQSQTACSVGFLITAPVGAIALTPRTQYWIGLSLASGANNQSALIANSSWQVVVY